MPAPGSALVSKRLALQGSNCPAPESCQRRGERREHRLPVALAHGVRARRGEEAAARLGHPSRPHLGNRRLEVPLRRKTEGVGGGDEPTHRGRNAAEPSSSATAAAIARGAIASANRASRPRYDEERWHQALASGTGRPRCARPRRTIALARVRGDVPSASPPMTTPPASLANLAESQFDLPHLREAAGVYAPGSQKSREHNSGERQNISPAGLWSART